MKNQSLQTSAPDRNGDFPQKKGANYALSPQDYRELESSGLIAEQIAQTGHFTILEKSQGKRIAGINHAGLCFAYTNPMTGEPYTTSKGRPFYRLKPRDWPPGADAPPKYLSAGGEGNKPYFSRLLKDFDRWHRNPKHPLILTEGEKKADKLAAEGYFAIGLAGVYGWLDSSPRFEEIEQRPAQLIEDDEEAQKDLEKGKLEFSRLLPELEEALEWKRRKVFLTFDSDACEKEEVRWALRDLAKQLKDLGANPYIVRIPTESDGSKNGADDFLVRHGKEAFEILLEVARPAIRGKTDLNFPQDPSGFEKMAAAIACLRHRWALHPLLGMMGWNGRCWESVSDIEFESQLSEFCDRQKWRNLRGFDSIKSHVRLRLLMRSSEWANPDWLVFKNGTLNLKTRHFGKHEQTHWQLSSLPYDYDRGAKCPQWQAFLREALQEDTQAIATIRAFFKWALLPKDLNQKLPIEKALDLLGPKGSGKGTCLDILAAVVGENNSAAFSADTFKSPNALSNLYGKKLAIDADATGSVEVGSFNKAVSGEPLQVKRLFKDILTLRLGCVFARAMNSSLAAPHGSEGLDRRIIAVAFDHRPERIDVRLGEKLRAELPGIFNWAWGMPQGDMEWWLLHGAAQSQAVEKASVERFEANNPPFVFLKERYLEGAEDISSSALYSEYRDWAKESGQNALSQKNFSQAIERLGCSKRLLSGRFFWAIPTMKSFDVAQFLGLKNRETETLIKVPHHPHLNPETPTQQEFQPSPDPHLTLTSPSPPSPQGEDEDEKERRIEKELFEKNPEFARVFGFFDAIESDSGEGGEGQVRVEKTPSPHSNPDTASDSGLGEGGEGKTLSFPLREFYPGDRVRYVGDNPLRIKTCLNKLPIVERFEEGWALCSHEKWIAPIWIPSEELELKERAQSPEESATDGTSLYKESDRLQTEIAGGKLQTAYLFGKKKRELKALQEDLILLLPQAHFSPVEGSRGDYSFEIRALDWGGVEKIYQFLESNDGDS